jgi:hypothetical protein
MVLSLVLAGQRLVVATIKGISIVCKVTIAITVVNAGHAFKKRLWFVFQT